MTDGEKDILDTMKGLIDKLNKEDIKDSKPETFNPSAVLGKELGKIISENMRDMMESPGFLASPENRRSYALDAWDRGNLDREAEKQRKERFLREWELDWDDPKNPTVLELRKFMDFSRAHFAIYGCYRVPPIIEGEFSGAILRVVTMLWDRLGNEEQQNVRDASAILDKASREGREERFVKESVDADLARFSGIMDEQTEE